MFSSFCPTVSIVVHKARWIQWICVDLATSVPARHKKLSLQILKEVHVQLETSVLKEVPTCYPVLLECTAKMPVCLIYYIHNIFVWVKSNLSWCWYLSEIECWTDPLYKITCTDLFFSISIVKTTYQTRKIRLLIFSMISSTHQYLRTKPYLWLGHKHCSPRV